MFNCNQKLKLPLYSILPAESTKINDLVLHIVTVEACRHIWVWTHAVHGTGHAEPPGWLNPSSDSTSCLDETMSCGFISLFIYFLSILFRFFLFHCVALDNRSFRLLRQTFSACPLQLHVSPQWLVKYTAGIRRRHRLSFHDTVLR